MQFNSYIFILCFLPLSLAGYFFLHHIKKQKAALAYLLVMSLWFYGYFNPSYLLIILCSIGVNYCLARLMEKFSKNPEDKVKKKAAFITGILFNVGLIFYFKYYDFFIQNINCAFKTDFVLKNIVLPLGISFFTFQQISFIADAYKSERFSYSFLEYALFVAYFPQLVAGPIVLHSELIPQFRDEKKHKPQYENLCRGIILFTMGLSKKMLIADIFGKAVDYGFTRAAAAPTGEGALTFYEVIIVMVSYTFQIYFDFSGYSDMATGLGRMFNFEIAQNFNSPYKAISVADFWKRWHMTLTRFLTTYVYIPLGGNRKGKIRTYINTMIVFIVSGIWHGANWTFILWGVLHGIGQCINKLFHNFYVGLRKSLEKSLIGKAVEKTVVLVSWLVTFGFLNVTWLLFRADSVSQWRKILSRLHVYTPNVKEELLECFRIPKLGALIYATGLTDRYIDVLWCDAFIYMALALVLCLLFKNNYQREWKINAKTLVLTWVLAIVCIVSMSSISTFLYFNF